MARRKPEYEPTLEEIARLKKEIKERNEEALKNIPHRSYSGTPYSIPCFHESIVYRGGYKPLIIFTRDS
tara:strand:- start:611 stop:817 length:207 start_codon:yes stop_codon:yes gene_type:complete